MAKLNITQRFDYRSAWLYTTGKISERFSHNIDQYLYECENKTFTRLNIEIPTKLQELEDTQNSKEYRKLLLIWLNEYKKVFDELDKADRAKAIKQIHVVKKDLNITQHDYRSLLMQTVKKQSSGNMTYCEIILCIHAMQQFAAGSLEITHWDGNNDESIN